MADSRREQVLASATQAFVRHGFRRVTMGDIAREAGLSRPALYLVFPNKEEIFRAVFRHWADRAAEQIAEELPSLGTPSERLRFAFEVWTVRPFELIQQHPDAGDLIDAPLEFMRETYGQVHREFEDILAGILTVDGHEHEGARAAARMLASASVGFKARAENVRELRALIETAAEAVVELVGRPVAS